MNHYAIIGTDGDTLLWHGLATSRTSARAAWLADVGYADGAPEHLDIEGTSVARVSDRRGDWLKVGQDWSILLTRSDGPSTAKTRTAQPPTRPTSPGTSLGPFFVCMSAGHFT